MPITRTRIENGRNSDMWISTLDKLVELVHESFEVTLDLQEMRELDYAFVNCDLPAIILSQQCTRLVVITRASHVNDELWILMYNGANYFTMLDIGPTLQYVLLGIRDIASRAN